MKAGRSNPMGRPVRLTKPQRAIFDQACRLIRHQERDLSIKEGRILELIAADFIAGASYEIQRPDQRTAEGTRQQPGG